MILNVAENSVCLCVLFMFWILDSAIYGVFADLVKDSNTHFSCSS